MGTSALAERVGARAQRVDEAARMDAATGAERVEPQGLAVDASDAFEADCVTSGAQGPNGASAASRVKTAHSSSTARIRRSARVFPSSIGECSG